MNFRDMKMFKTIKKFRNLKNFIGYALIIFIIIMIIVTYRQLPTCDKIEIIDTSVTVKDIGSRSLLGMNADTDSLAFGVVSPGTEVIRSINVQDSDDVLVTVAATAISGEFSSWISIDPAQFSLNGGENKMVFFKLIVPGTAADGNYTGEIKFCFRE